MMKYKGYLGKVDFDDEAKLLHGQVVGLRDVITFQADDAKGIEKAFHDSVDDYLAFCADRGEKPEKEYSGNFVLRIDPDLHRKLDLAAQASGKSLNSVATDILTRNIHLDDFRKRSPSKSRKVSVGK